MASIAFVDHYYHRKTKSTEFLKYILVNCGHSVSVFHDESNVGGSPVRWSDIRDYDAVIFFQVMAQVFSTVKYRDLHPNVTFIPMLDQFLFWEDCHSDYASLWNLFRGSKVLNFSAQTHAMSQVFGIASHYTRYFPPPAPAGSLKSRRSRTGDLAAFFWLRREDQVPWWKIRELIGQHHFSKVHIHVSEDPGSPEVVMPTEEEIKNFNIYLSRWYESKEEFLARLGEADVFFAPRASEGIGQAFLEACAQGQCVVSPDMGTMNEYIVNNVNGLLYDLWSPAPLDFSRARDLGAAAADMVVQGHEDWLRNQEQVVKFLLTPADEIYGRKWKNTSRIKKLNDFRKSGTKQDLYYLARMLEKCPVFKCVAGIIKRIRRS